MYIYVSRQAMKGISSTQQAPAHSSIPGHSRTVHVESTHVAKTHRCPHTSNPTWCWRSELLDASCSFLIQTSFTNNSAKLKTTTTTKALHESTYMGATKVAKPLDRKENGGCRGLGEGEMGRCSTGVKFQSGKMSNFWRPALQHTTYR